MSHSLRPHGLSPARLLHTWDFPGMTIGVGCHFVLQGIFLTQGSNPGLLYCRRTLYHLSHQGSKTFWSCHAAYGILLPQPGVKLVPPALESQSLNHQTIREIPTIREVIVHLYYIRQTFINPLLLYYKTLLGGGPYLQRAHRTMGNMNMYKYI